LTPNAPKEPKASKVGLSFSCCHFLYFLQRGAKKNVPGRPLICQEKFPGTTASSRVAQRCLMVLLARILGGKQMKTIGLRLFSSNYAKFLNS
jgi:hypothetical protein